jgi:hypothetical protein
MLRESPSQVASKSPQRRRGGRLQKRIAILARVNRVLPGVEKRLFLNHPRKPVSRLGDGTDGFGRQVSSINNS